jgi:regulator of sigma E protease
MSIIIFVAILLALIIVHEFGHFIVAKKSGIRVDEFGIGFPPKALTLSKKGETEYTLNWLPLGGFVKIFGENPNEESISGPDSARSFVNKPKIIQAAVLIAGVFFNLLFAWFLFWITFMVGVPTALYEEEIPTARDVRLIVSEVLPESPAALAGLQNGDEIASLQFENTRIENLTPTSVTEFVSAHERDVLSAEIIRGDEKLTLSVEPVPGLISAEPERPAIGIAMGLVGLVRYNPFIAVWESLKYTVQMTSLIGGAIVSFFAEALTFQANFSEVAGPVGIVGMVGDASAMGFVFLLNFTAFISINLAIINLLPFPALDGGRLLFVIIEKIKGSPIRPKVANILNTAGFAFLILLMILVTYNDVLRLFG